MSADVKKFNSVLEPELRELCGELSATERIQTAQKFMRWVDQLTESAAITNPEIVSLVAPPKVPRGFFLVNMAKWQQEKLRAMAHTCGVDLRSVMNWAVTHTMTALQEKTDIANRLGIDPRKMWELVQGSEKN